MTDLLFFKLMSLPHNTLSIYPRLYLISMFCHTNVFILTSVLPASLISISLKIIFCRVDLKFIYVQRNNTDDSKYTQACTTIKTLLCLSKELHNFRGFTYPQTAMLK